MARAKTHPTSVAFWRVPDRYRFDRGFGSRERGIYRSMYKRVEIEIDEELLQEVVRRYRLADPREGVHLALRTLLDLDAGDPADQLATEYDEFSDLRALRPRSAS
jgi:Arc/MetJ family transcription regulator